MDRIGSLKRDAVMRELKQYDKYNDLSTREIVERVGKNDIHSFRAELFHLESKQKKQSTHKSTTKPNIKSNTSLLQAETLVDLPADLNINYLKHLKYTDMINLCRTNKALSGICHDDTLLKQIIFEKTGVIVDKKYNVAQILYTFDKNITDLVYSNFPIKFLPDYVDAQKFYRSIKNRLYFQVIDIITDNVLNRVDVDNDTFLEITNINFVVPFVSNNIDLDEIIDEYMANHYTQNLKLPKFFYSYIIQYVGDIKKLDRPLSQSFKKIIKPYLLL